MSVNIGVAFELAPKSEQTLKRHKYEWEGFKFVNDIGHPCEYRILYRGMDLGMIKYYKGRILSCYQLKETSTHE